MNPNKETIKNLIESSGKILIAAQPSADEATNLSALALKKILENAGKEVFLYPLMKERFLWKFKKILPEFIFPEIPQKIKIKIPKKTPVDELSYEEEDEFLNIVISPKNRIDTENLLIERSSYDMDSALCFFQNEDGWKKIKNVVTKPARDKNIYFSNNGRTLAEKINDIYQTINDLGHEQSIPSQIATLLMFSLICETENFQKNQSPRIFSLANYLLESGADKNNIDEILSADKNPNLVQFLGRALARTTTAENLKTSWTFLTKQDFDKTSVRIEKENILFVLRKVRAHMIPQTCSIICYESGAGVDSIVFSENEAVLNSMASAIGLEPESSYFFASNFKNFSEAETHLSKLLKQNVSVKMYK